MPKKSNIATITRITHEMADGTIRDSMEGVVVPRTPETEAVYLMAEEYIRKMVAQQYEGKQTG